MAKSKKDTLALFEVIHRDKGQDLLKPAPHTRLPGAEPASATPIRKGVWLRLTPLHLAIALLVVLAIASTAYLAGRKQPALPHDGPSSEDVRRGPVDPQVLDPRPASANPDLPPMTPVENPSVPGAVGIASSGAGVPAANGRRTVGLTYVVVQSYPTADDARRLCDYLTRAGIPCTVEKGLPGYSNTWYSVVTTTGFPRVSSPEYADYGRQIRAAAKPYPGPKFLKDSEQLGAYKWR